MGFGLRLRCLAAATLLEALAVSTGFLIGATSAAARPTAHLRVQMEEAARDSVAPAPSEVAVPIDEPQELPAEPPVVPELLMDPLSEPPTVDLPAETAAAEPPADPGTHPAAWLSSLARRQPDAVPVPPQPPSPPATPKDAITPVPAPVPGWNAPPPYPADAIRLGLEGQVTFELVLGGDGSVQSLRVVRSSGHALLDLVARKALARWRFTHGPATVPWTVEFRLAARDVTVSAGASER